MNKFAIGSVVDDAEFVVQATRELGLNSRIGLALLCATT